jgi:Zn-dependent M16 (insulinase) family peptidase
MLDEHAGFVLVREQSVSELDTVARLFRHRRTGAEVLSLSNRDENKSFAITFRTLPSDGYRGGTHSRAFCAQWLTQVPS